MLLRLLGAFSNELLYNTLVNPSHESTRLNTIATETGGVAVLFHTVKLISDLSSNDVIHNLFGPAVRFGTVADLGSPIFFNSLDDPNADRCKMNYRYKIFEVQTSHLGNLPGDVSIMNDPRSIGAILREKIQSGGGATAYGVECSSFAWFIKGEFHYLLLREDDAHFNIDLAMIHLSRLPGRSNSDFFPAIGSRMTRPSSGLHSKLASKGLNPISCGAGLSHGGMGGVLFRDPNNTLRPVFAAPPLPHLNLADSSLFEELMDDWFRQIRDMLIELKSRFAGLDIAFESGGTFPIPDWFKDWCRSQGIGIMLFDPIAS